MYINTLGHNICICKYDRAGAGRNIVVTVKFVRSVCRLTDREQRAAFTRQIKTQNIFRNERTTKSQ